MMSQIFKLALQAIKEAGEQGRDELQTRMMLFMSPSAAQAQDPSFIQVRISASHLPKSTGPLHCKPAPAACVSPTNQHLSGACGNTAPEQQRGHRGGLCLHEFQDRCLKAILQADRTNTARVLSIVEARAGAHHKGGGAPT